MAEIHVLPISLDPVRLSRACEALHASFVAGDDLGDRACHIRMLLASLNTA